MLIDYVSNDGIKVQFHSSYCPFRKANWFCLKFPSSYHQNDECPIMKIVALKKNEDEYLLVKKVKYC